MVLERQPALKLANPHILAQRMDAYSRATGLDAYQLLYMAARLPPFLRLSPPVLKERCEALAKSLALGFEDVLKLLVSQPAAAVCWHDCRLVSCAASLHVSSRG
ncbi:hypothetical protein Vretifemale_8340 [Volvox reticuliferus]|uniref:Uncharacterized protein n=1 Tax=Volvox reticuliferus TaxID=1737510 RepID=A0A8J4CCB7_9CHLO|nr:hypothetical protein Vretifemale_8340 [Volvox reticuliferus]